MYFFYELSKESVFCDIDEVAYYLGYKKTSPISNDILTLIRSSLVDMQKIITPKAVYAEFELSLQEENKISFADVLLKSSDLTRNLKNCKKVILFAATIGQQVDLMIRKSQFISTATSAVMQACGAAFVEKFVDKVNEKIAKDALAIGFKSHPRFSPGYGDVPLIIQKDFFRLLPCNKIALSLMNTLIMTPEKSVTAFIGLEEIL